MPGAFKLDHLHPVKPILFSKFYNFFTFILEANSYYPRELIMRKGNSPNSRNGPDRGVSVPGAFKLDHLKVVALVLSKKLTTFISDLRSEVGPRLRELGPPARWSQEAQICTKPCPIFCKDVTCIAEGGNSPKVSMNI